jgi:hypothetical protein
MRMEPDECIESAQHTWVIDRIRQRFRRLPRGRDPRDPRLAADWQPYFAFWSDPDGAFTISLDAAGTRRHRVVAQAPAA